MVFNGYKVDGNLTAFRKYFDLPELLKALDSQIVLLKWVNGMCALPHQEEETVARFAGVREALDAYYGEETAYPVNQEKDHSAPKVLMDMKAKVKPEMLPKYMLFSWILRELMELGKYNPGKADGEYIQTYLEQQGFFREKRLEIVGDGKNGPELYFGDELVAALPGVDVKKDGKLGIVTMASHPDTGYLGITADGKLVNASAFSVPALKAKPVKVLMNQMRYVILLEDGMLVHNLRYSAVPSGPVKNVALSAERLTWEPWETERKM